MQRAWPMQRLLQGDVGAGKTIVALLAALVAMENGYQVAFMAPTEILAEQHFRTIVAAARGDAYRVALLTGRVTAADARDAAAGDRARRDPARRRHARAGAGARASSSSWRSP